MQSVRTPTRLRTSSKTRAAVGLRLRAARLMAGGVSLRQLADAGGLSYSHLCQAERGREPLTPSDLVTLSEQLGVPSSWLRDGWD